jgi:hypothetical protein
LLLIIPIMDPPDMSGEVSPLSKSSATAWIGANVIQRLIGLDGITTRAHTM